MLFCLVGSGRLGLVVWLGLVGVGWLVGWVCLVGWLCLGLFLKTKKPTKVGLSAVFVQNSFLVFFC